jgi:hypothetical protein
LRELLARGGHSPDLTEILTRVLAADDGKPGSGA